MKQLLRAALLRIKRLVFSHFSGLTGWYYRHFWSPKKDSLDEQLSLFAMQHLDPFVVQVGANDGFQNDPLFKFIKAYDWRGICLEPQPVAFGQLRQIYRRNRVRPLQLALADTVGKLPFYQLAFTSQRWASGLSSFSKQHIESQIASGYVEKKAAKYRVSLPANRNTWIRKIEVNTSDFGTLFTDLAIRQVDLLHIDTEGFDAEVFRLFPLEEYQPTLVLIEVAHLSPADQDAITERLLSNGYASKRFGVDLLAQKG